ncbi:MAG: 50S ribosomal protein L5 [bacterium]|nr:50S ribosomal protein L5 [bacterium]
MTKSSLNSKETYLQNALPILKEKLKRENLMSLPRVDHIVVASGVGKHAKEGKFLEDVEKGLVLLTGQKPAQTLSKKSIAGFKLRENQVAGLMVTLRGKRMDDFLKKLIHVVFPRVRDFRGVQSKCIDQNGNMSVGIREAAAFPEVDPQKIETIFGLQVTVVTTAKNKEEAKVLFESIGFPLTDAAIEDTKVFGVQKKTSSKKHA